MSYDFCPEEFEYISDIIANAMEDGNAVSVLIYDGQVVEHHTPSDFKLRKTMLERGKKDDSA